jgi:hypothetical protein
MRKKLGISMTRPKKNAPGAPMENSGAASEAVQQNPVIATTGGVFEDGSMIELVRDVTHRDRLQLLHWDGTKACAVPRVELNGRVFEPAAVDPTVMRAMSLPTKCESCGSVRQLLDDIARIFAVHAALEEAFARIVGRFVLSSYIVEGLPMAPSLRIVGSETIAGIQLLQILTGLCRHAIRLTEVTAAGICALPLEWNPTLLIPQRELDPRLQCLLDAAQRPNEFIPRGRRLLNMHCAVATFSETGGINGHKFTGIEILAPPLNRHVEILAEDSLRRMAEGFQARLLCYCFENFRNARSSNFDAPQFLPPIRDHARSLGACTPDDAGLQAELLGFLEARDVDLRSEKWVDLTVIVLEAILALIHEGEETAVYVGEIAKAAEAILRGRGETREVEPREVGQKLRLLGFKTETRDARGYKLLLTQEVSRRVHELARNFAAPSIEVPLKGCEYCKSFSSEDQDGQVNVGG